MAVGFNEDRTSIRDLILEKSLLMIAVGMKTLNTSVKNPTLLRMRNWWAFINKTMTVNHTQSRRMRTQ